MNRVWPGGEESQQGKITHIEHKTQAPSLITSTQITMVSSYFDQNQYLYMLRLTKIAEDILLEPAHPSFLKLFWEAMSFT